MQVHAVNDSTWNNILTQEFPGLLTPTFNLKEPKHKIKHHIQTTGPPVFARARRLHPDRLAAAKKEFKFMLDNGNIRRSNSSYASPLHMQKKPDGSFRPCGDFRALNASTVADKYPIPHMQDLSANLAGCKLFSKVDLVKGFFNTPVAPEDIHKTAVITPFGLFEFVRMPFGLCNAAQMSQRMMDSILHDLEDVYVYLDDILVASKDSASHCQALCRLFRRLNDHGLAVHPSKCQFAQAQLTFLGHRVTAAGIAPLPERVEAINKFPAPMSKTGLQEFLGMINYYHRFLPRAAHIMSPLYAALKKSASPFCWTAEMQSAFDQAKTELANATLLVHPCSSATYCITTDASHRAVGASLEQSVEGQWQPLAFFSATLRPAETRYSAFDRELLAVYLAIKHFLHMLEGRQFTVYTDHKPLTYALQSTKTYTERQVRHISFISEHSTDIRHLPGKFNAAADALSRNPPAECRNAHS